jgi:cytochrome c
MRQVRAALICAGIVALTACNVGRRDRDESAAMLTGGDPRQGAALIDAYGCDACHTIPGIRGADAQVGPALGGVVERVYIAGVLKNTPENLVRWIQDPQAVDERTAMPTLGVSEREARHIAAYLYSLR